jgi:hypothetical protein
MNGGGGTQKVQKGYKGASDQRVESTHRLLSRTFSVAAILSRGVAAGP